MKHLLKNDAVINLLSHQAVAWVLVKASSFYGYIRVFI